MRLGGSLRRRRSGVKWTVRYGKSAGGIKAYVASQFGQPRFLLGVGALAVVGLFAGYLLATRVIFPAPPPPGDVERVPDLSGETFGSATGALSSMGFVLEVTDSLRHPSASPGSIVGQTPLPGQLALVGDTIRVALSLGPEVRPIPDVTRLRADRARTVLEATGFLVVVDSTESELPRGSVITMAPEAGMEAVIPQEIRLTVSLGPPLVEMPHLLGLREEQARAVLDSLGLSLSEVETRFRFGRDQGLVVEQEPPAATQVERGSAVRLVVGRRGG
ncbi:MAG: PASTA domain-containing protein [Gemmatimonadota bacterium]|jgi:serine/threonine-protein kinase